MAGPLGDVALLMKVLDYRLPSEAFGERKANFAEALPTVPYLCQARTPTPRAGGDLTPG